MKSRKFMALLLLVLLAVPMFSISSFASGNPNPEPGIHFDLSKYWKLMHDPDTENANIKLYVSFNQTAMIKYMYSDFYQGLKDRGDNSLPKNRSKFNNSYMSEEWLEFFNEASSENLQYTSVEKEYFGENEFWKFNGNYFSSGELFPVILYACFNNGYLYSFEYRDLSLSSEFRNSNEFMEFSYMLSGLIFENNTIANKEDLPVKFIIAIAISLICILPVPLVIRSRGIFLTKRKVYLISALIAALSTFIVGGITLLMLAIMDFNSSGSAVYISLSPIASFFIVKSILKPTTESIAKKYPNASVAIYIINKYKEDNALDIFANGVCFDILASYKNVQLLEQKIINSKLPPQEYAYNDLISNIERRLEWVAYRDPNTHELNKNGQALLDIQQKIIKDLESFRNPKVIPSDVETISSEPTNVTPLKTQNIAAETETKTAELKINNAETISKQVKYIVMDIDNKVGFETFSNRVAMPVWKKANNLNGIQTAFEKSGLTVNQFAFQSLIFEIDSVLDSDDYFLAKQLMPIRQMLERNYNNSITQK